MFDSVSTDRFTFHKTSRLIISEMSDIGRFVKFYNDVSKVEVEGLLITNPKTGNTTAWAVSNTIRSKENEIMVWELELLPETIRAFPDLIGWRVNILND